MFEHMNKRNSKLKFYILVSLISLVQVSTAQLTDQRWPTKNNAFLQGFEVEVSGERLDFLPGLTNGQVALLARATDGNNMLEFKTATIPANYNKDFVSFVWSAAIGQSLQDPSGSFDFYIDNEKYFTFKNHVDSLNAEWQLNNGAAELIFIPTEFTKGSQDAFGYMFLNVPKSIVTAGKRLSIKVIGNNHNSMDWYMPFGIPVENSFDILAEPALVKTEGGLKQRIKVQVNHAGAPTDIQFKLDGKLVKTVFMKPGEKDFYLLVDPVSQTKEVKLEIGKKGSTTRSFDVTLKPVRKFEVYFLAHSHVDIGFTHTQDDVEELQWRNFDLGIDLAEKTKDYPDGAQFKWNAEITWAIDGYLKNADEQKKKRFVDAVNNGWIGLDALIGSQLTGLQREEELINNQRFSNELMKKYDFNINSAMISDVPGYSWGTVESLAQSGIKYFSSGPNHMPHLPHGGYQVGHTFEAWGDIPFYWASASGKEKVLFWMTSHGYSWFHSWSVDILSKAGGGPVLRHLDELEQQGYPYDIVQLRYTVGNDNGPPDATMPDFIKEWNETYEYPKMRIATNQEMMEDFEQKYGDELPTYKGDFTPYWEDGAASSALETGMNRKTADQLVQAETLWTMTKPSATPIKRFDEAWKNVLLYSEHTWGANISKSQPDSDFTKSLWDVKQAFAFNAQQESEGLVNDAIDYLTDTSEKIEAIMVLNTTSWERTNLVKVSADWDIIGDRVTDENGNKITTQRLSTGELVFIAKDVPALGSKKYLLKKGKSKSKSIDSNSSSLSNDQISLSINEMGELSSLTYANGNNLIDVSDTLGFNAYWYGGLIKEGLSKQGKTTTSIVENGPLVYQLKSTSTAPGAQGIEREVMLIKGMDDVFITNTVDKNRVTENENVRFTFPFNVENGQVRIDVPWATVTPEKDQLKGANKNFYSVQRWVDISNENIGVTLAPIEAPLLEIGDMNGQKWMVDMEVRPWIKKYEPSGRLISWVMNNAWFVNYKAFQEGKIPFHYVLRPHQEFDHFETKKFGIEQTQPLMLVPVKQDAAPIQSSIQLKNSQNILITSLKMSIDGKAIMLRVFNPTDENGSALLTDTENRQLYLSSSKEEKGEKTESTIQLAPWEVRTYRIER